MVLYPNQYLKTYLTDWGYKVTPLDTVTVKSAFNKYYTFIFDIRGVVAPSHLCSVCHFRFEDPSPAWEAGWELGCFCLDSLPLSVHRASHLISAGLATWRRMTDENRVPTGALLPIVVQNGEAVDGGSDECGATRPPRHPAIPPPGLLATLPPDPQATLPPDHPESCGGRYEDSQLLVFIPDPLDESQVWESEAEPEKVKELTMAAFTKETKDSGKSAGNDDKLHFTANEQLDKESGGKTNQEVISISDTESEKEMNWCERRFKLAKSSSDSELEAAKSTKTTKARRSGRIATRALSSSSSSASSRSRSPSRSPKVILLYKLYKYLFLLIVKLQETCT